MSRTNLFIVGAAKSGTTSFHDYLNQHPDIEMSSIKEPNFFSHEEIGEDNLYYRDAPLIKNEQEYQNLFRKHSKILGESSVSYLFYKEAAEKISNYNKHAKILIFLRNPVDRAYSHYLMDYSAGYVKESFGLLIRNKNVNSVAYQQSVEYSFYAEQIERFIKLFPSDQIKIMVLEEVKQDIEGCLSEIENFLSIKNYQDYTLGIKNSYSSSNNPIIKSLYTSVKLKSFLRKCVSKDKINYLKSIFLNSEKPELLNSDREYLTDLYSSDVERLSTIMNKDLGAIWK